jgi:hypothetical protein
VLNLGILRWSVKVAESGMLVEGGGGATRGKEFSGADGEMSRPAAGGGS